MNSANTSKDTRAEQDRIRAQLVRIYTPGEPITNPNLFSGRTELLLSLQNQLAIPGKVFILYGERGVGKTSFYNVLIHGRQFVKYSCTSKDNFTTIFLNILRSLGEHLTEKEIKDLIEAGYEVGVKEIVKATAKVSDETTFEPLAKEILDQASVLRRLKKAQNRVDAIVFDEFQELKDPEIHSQINGLVKALSDNKVKVRLFFVGIAESDEALFPPVGDYPEYKLRHYIAAKIPRMSASELEDIIDRRKNIYSIYFEPAIKSEIAKIASGYPSTAHTLALSACFGWLTLNAGKLVTNWVASLPWIGNWLQSRGLEVEKIDLRVEDREFSMGISQFLNQFHNSYGQQATQLRTGLTSTDSALVQGILLQLADVEDVGAASGDLADALHVENARVTDVIGNYPALIVQDANSKSWRLRSPYLRGVIRAYDYLQRKQPERFAELFTPSRILVQKGSDKV